MLRTISVYMQGGLQPIHLAAQEGHLNVVKLLAKEFNVQADTAKDVKIVFHKINVHFVMNYVYRMVAKRSILLASKVMKNYFGFLLKILKLVPLLGQRYELCKKFTTTSPSTASQTMEIKPSTCNSLGFWVYR